MWLYGSGFPKSQNIGKKIKKWNGWGACLKPAYEPIIVARKPFKGSLVDNVIENGVGGLNIDECRISNTSYDEYDLIKRKVSKATGSDNDGHFLDELHNLDIKHGVTENGRFPANIIHDGLEEEWSRYFYCAKASKKDRDEGLDDFEELPQKNIYGDGFNSATKLVTLKQIETGQIGNRTLRKNTHPTVKPTELMQYLIRLVSPKGSIILDPFMGSGSTGKAIMYENKEQNANYKFIGIELTEEYLPIAEARINYAMKQSIEENKQKQLDLFEME